MIYNCFAEIISMLMSDIRCLGHFLTLSDWMRLDNSVEKLTTVENAKEMKMTTGLALMLFWFVSEKQSATSFPCDEIPLQPQIKITYSTSPIVYMLKKKPCLLILKLSISIKNVCFSCLHKQCKPLSALGIN